MQDFVNGGGEWIRTTEVVDNRFTVCPLWPLGNSPINDSILYKACPAVSVDRTASIGFLQKDAAYSRAVNPTHCTDYCARTGSSVTLVELVNGLEPLTC